MDFIKWANTSKTALYVQAPQTISEEDSRAILHTIRMMRATVDHPVDLIVDRRKTVNVPSNMLVLMREVISKQQYRHVVFIGFALLPKMLVETLARLPGVFASDPIFADNLLETYEKLDITDPILNDDTQQK